MTFTTIVLVGSLRRESINLKLAKAIAKLGESRFTSQFPQIGDLPLYNEDLENPMPESVARLKREIEAADAVLFITPEYNRAVPGVLKNAIDWASRPYGQSSFKGKPAALGGASPGAIGTAVAQHDMRGMLGYLDVILLSQPELYLQFKPDLIDADGNVASDDTRKFLQKFTDTYAAAGANVISVRASPCKRPPDHAGGADPDAGRAQPGSETGVGQKSHRSGVRSRRFDAGQRPRHPAGNAA